jgi:glycine cleavage system protein P-like pyridoxal-binding family
MNSGKKNNKHELDYFIKFMMIVEKELNNIKMINKNKKNKNKLISRKFKEVLISMKQKSREECKNNTKEVR